MISFWNRIFSLQFTLPKGSHSVCYVTMGGVTEILMKGARYLLNQAGSVLKTLKKK